MLSPAAVPEDPPTSVDRGHELRHAAVPAIREHASMSTAPALDRRCTVMHRVVAVAWAAAGDGNDATVRPPCEDLEIAGPAIVLGLRRTGVIASRNQGTVDEPRPPSVADDRPGQERGQPTRQVGDDAMRLRLRDRERGPELAHREVGAEADPADDGAARERKRPAPTALAFGGRSRVTTRPSSAPMIERNIPR